MRVSSVNVCGPAMCHHLIAAPGRLWGRRWGLRVRKLLGVFVLVCCDDAVGCVSSCLADPGAYGVGGVRHAVRCYPVRHGGVHSPSLVNRLRNVGGIGRTGRCQSSRRCSLSHWLYLSMVSAGSRLVIDAADASVIVMLSARRWVSVRRAIFPVVEDLL